MPGMDTPESSILMEVIVYQVLGVGLVPDQGAASCVGRCSCILVKSLSHRGVCVLALPVWCYWAECLSALSQIKLCGDMRWSVHLREIQLHSHFVVE
jgi:hypothetical protein